MLAVETFDVVRSSLISLLLGVVILAFGLWKRSRKPANHPPGYSGVPVLGVLPFIRNERNLPETLRRWKVKIGEPLFYFQLGLQDCVVVSDFKTASEFLIKMGKITSGRPNFQIFNDTYNDKGFAFSDFNNTFKVLKKFAAVSIRNYGVANKEMETRVAVECEILSQELLKYGDKSFDPKHLVSAATANIICQVMFGERYDYENPRFKDMLDLMYKVINNKDDGKYICMMIFLYQLRYFPLFRGVYQRLHSNLRKRKAIFQAIVDEHKETFDPNVMRDMVDYFLLKRMPNPDDPIFEESQVMQIATGLFDAGTDTTSNTLRWGLVIMMKHPEIQERVAEEIRNVIGDAAPSLTHQKDMPYTSAFIDEIYRLVPVFPIAIMHKASETFEYNGYKIPAGTMIIPNIWAIHHDADEFPDPFAFKPERWINKETGAYEKAKTIMPFGFGPRYCLGEKLAEREVFLFFTGILQRLRVTEDPNHPLPGLDEGVFGGMIYSPSEFYGKFSSRL